MKRILKSLLIILISSLIIVGLILGATLLINHFADYNFKDTFFVLGIIVVIIGVCSFISGDSKGLSLQFMGSLNSQYASNANLEIAKTIKEKKIKNIKNIASDIWSIAFVVGGLLCIILNFIF